MNHSSLKLVESLYLVAGFLVSTVCLFSTPQPSFDAGGSYEFLEPYSDEFNDGSLNTNKWDNNIGDWGTWSWEPERASLNASGELEISMVYDLHDRWGTPIYYKSGEVQTKAQPIKYGIFEARIKGASPNPGVCPAFWLYRDETRVTANVEPPVWTEIDIMECGQDTSNTHAIFHNFHIWEHPLFPEDRGGYLDDNSRGTRWDATWLPEDDYHVYGIIWSPDWLIFYVDGEVQIKRRNIWFHQALDVILSMGLREPYKSNPDSAPFPATMTVDWVRAWKIEPNTPEPPQGRDLILHTDAPWEFPPNSTQQVNVEYSVLGPRNLRLSLVQVVGGYATVVGPMTQSISAGSGTAEFIVPVGNLPVGDEKYEWRVDIYDNGNQMAFDKLPKVNVVASGDSRHLPTIPVLGTPWETASYHSYIYGLSDELLTDSIILNGDFEAGLDHWDAIACNLSLTANGVDASGACYVQGRQHTFAGPYQDITSSVIKDEQYQFSAMINAENGNACNARFIIKQQDANGTTYSNIGVAGWISTQNSNSWVNIEATDTISWTGSLQAMDVFVQLTDASRNYTVDNIEVRFDGLPEPTINPEGGVINNSSFEDGLNYWREVNCTSTIVMDSFAGQQACLITGRSHHDNSLYQEVTSLVNNGQSYDFSGWVKVDSGSVPGTGCTVRFVIKQQDASGIQYKNIGSVDWIPPSAVDTWVQVQTTDTISWTGTLEKLEVYIQVGDSSRDVVLDSISVKESGP